MTTESLFIQRFDLNNPPSFAECGRHCSCQLPIVEFFLTCLQEESRFHNLFKGCQTDYDVMERCIEFLKDPDAPLNLLSFIVDIYTEKPVPDKKGNLVDTMQNNLKWCLDHKADIIDCIYGCCSIFRDKDFTDIGKRKRNTHQYCISTVALETMVELVTATDVARKLMNEELSPLLEKIYDRDMTRDFAGVVEELDRLREEAMEKREIGGKAYSTFRFAGLSTYDSALRLVWHTARREELLPKGVYLYRGPLWATKSLMKIGNLTDRELIHCEDPRSGRPRSPRSGDILMPEAYPKEFSKVELYQLENLLCIFHPVLDIWRVILEEKRNAQDGKSRKIRCADRTRAHIAELKNTNIS